MITATELQQYTTLDHKLEKFFRKLDNKVKKQHLNNGRRLSVLIYDEFVADIGLFTQVQQQLLHRELYDNWVMKDPEIFNGNNRSLFMCAVQQKLLHEYGYTAVNWSDFNHKNISNAIQLTFCW